VIGVIIAGLVVTLSTLGGRALRWALWVSALLGFLGLVGFVVLTTGALSAASVSPVLADPLVMLGGVSVVSSGLLVLFAHAGGDLTKLYPGSGRSVVPLVVAIGALVPLTAGAVMSVLVASTNPSLALTLVTDPVGSLVAGLPSWYPAPAIVVFALPLAGFAALLLFGAGKATDALVSEGSRRVGTAITGVFAVIAATLVLVFEVNLVAYFPDVLLTLGVVFAAWSGVFAVDSLIARNPSEKAFRGGPFVGMLVAIGLGFGLVPSSVSWLAWQGYLFPVLSQMGLIDLSPATPGVLIAGVFAAIVGLITGLASRKKETVHNHD